MALKLVSEEISHKSDAGGVKLGVVSEEDAKKIFGEFQSITTHLPSAKLTGVLVQKMLRGSPELILGAKRDETFGPVLLFGLGGIWTEIYKDVSMCVHPWRDRDLEAMLSRIKGNRLLDGYRGGALVDKQALIQMLKNLGQMMLENPSILGVDLNPVIPDSSQGLAAVDARILVGKPVEVRDEPLAKPEEVTPLFEPESIAVIGASENTEKIAGMVIPRLLKFGFPREKIYPVNPNRSNIIGLPCYRSIGEITTRVDLACIVVPPQLVEKVLEEAGEKGVRAAIIFSSGFEEAGKREAQEKLREIARRHGMRLCGPNTEGAVSPSNNSCATFSPTLDFFQRLPSGEGAIVTQSGGIMIYLLSNLADQGYGVSRAVSSANEADLGLSDYLRFFASDSKTKAVGAFLEGVKHGPKLARAIESLIEAKKPLIVVKAGRSEKGAMAARFHTGAMTGSYEAYRALFNQLGVVEAEDLEEIMDYLQAFTLQPVPKGERLVVISSSGGANTMLADWCHERGIVLPELSKGCVERLSKILPEFAALRNPMDLTGQALGDPTIFERVMDEVIEEGDIFLMLRVGGAVKAAKSIVKSAEMFRSKGKTIVACWMTSKQYAEESRRLLLENKVPVYGTPLKAMKAIDAMVRYSRFLQSRTLG